MYVQPKSKDLDILGMKEDKLFDIKVFVFYTQRWILLKCLGNRNVNSNQMVLSAGDARLYVETNKCKKQLVLLEHPELIFSMEQL